MREPFTAACGLAWLASVACTAPQDPLNAAMPAPSATVVVAPPPSTTPDRCFGDSPPEAIARDVRPKDLFANGSVVLWRSGELIYRMDPASGRTSTFDASSLIFIVAADSRDVFGATPVLDLVAIDLSSGQSRAVSRSSGWTTGSATRNLRAVVTRTVQPLIERRPVPGDLTGLHSQFLATDGRFLYWADNGGDRVVRWRR
jgi:hypothetical protein